MKEEKVYQDSVPLQEMEDMQTRHSLESSGVSSVSSTSAVLEGISDANGHGNGYHDATYSSKKPLMHDNELDGDDPHSYDPEDLEYRPPLGIQGPSRTTKRVLWIMCALAVCGWLLALLLFLRNGTRVHVSDVPFEHHSDSDKAGTKVSTGSGSAKAITLGSILAGEWYGRSASVSWLATSDGRDGLILETSGQGGRGALVVEDVRARANGGDGSQGRITLMQESGFRVGGAGNKFVMCEKSWPSADLKHVLCMNERQQNWRHSFTGLYWIFDVETQTGQPLDPAMAEGRVQLAQWSPRSDSVVFTRENNLFIRHLNSEKVIQVTDDGGPEFFYGVPDWVYEEEVLADRIGTWFSSDGQFVAFLQTNETKVPEYPVQYFIQRPSGNEPTPGLEKYPETRLIKYPKAGSPNPVVHLKYYNVQADEIVDVTIEKDFPDDDRLIAEVVWCEGGQLIIHETNRESDTMKTILVHVGRRTGKVLREVDVAGLDGGWFEVPHNTHFVPSDPGKGRPHAGYIDTVIHEGYDHLAYFTPLDNPVPVMLTSGDWEVVSAPSAVDLENNIVYFVSTKQGPATRHVYSVKLDGTDMQPLAQTSEQTDSFWSVDFSSRAGFALLAYRGPGIPTYEIVGTPGNLNATDFQLSLENNDALRRKAAEYDLPDRTYTTVKTTDGKFDIPVLELRPPHFDPGKKYPVILAPYGGPNSQEVDKTWKVDYQAYLAAGLGYIVLIADPRGTGYNGRAYRCAVRGALGALEVADQIAVAKTWADKPFIDADRVAIWGWSYGAFLALKALEVDAGETFSYGAAVAPVTDWSLYDSVYAERYMHTPAHNPDGYEHSTITNMTALGQSVRFLVMHGTGDDNVHIQNSLILLDGLDLAGVKNFDFHAYPDSAHSIFFHNGHRMVYERLTDWLINAFNGEWLITNDPVPSSNIDY